ncbi:unnamed protein product [Arabidopsis lyrata]|uniref:Predicted protein n=1 Tax=Arabidopsis lyrata subsp. lyrata TaxID=81972 RepID=D7L018_ARALL|nr:predicted protein [Arabidopsis lyrata subsp. lyrata]CAH8262134.1 unnamed protein product [Arabidopsis lyrata]
MSSGVCDAIVRRRRDLSSFLICLLSQVVFICFYFCVHLSKNPKLPLHVAFFSDCFRFDGRGNQ